MWLQLPALTSCHGDLTTLSKFTRTRIETTFIFPFFTKTNRLQDPQNLHDTKLQNIHLEFLKCYKILEIKLKINKIPTKTVDYISPKNDSLKIVKNYIIEKLLQNSNN